MQLFPSGSSVTLDGPDLDVLPSAIMPISLMLHELVTNSLKHGAMSRPSGSVAIGWHVPDGADHLEFDWQETLDAPVADSGREGYGTVLIRAVIERMLGGSFERNFAGQQYRFAAQISRDHFRVRARPSGAAARIDS